MVQPPILSPKTLQLVSDRLGNDLQIDSSERPDVVQAVRSDLQGRLPQVSVDSEADKIVDAVADGKFAVGSPEARGLALPEPESMRLSAAVDQGRRKYHGTSDPVPLSWREWFFGRAATPSREYPDAAVADQPSSQMMARCKDHIYFVDRGHVFAKDVGSGKVDHLPGPEAVKGIVVHKDQLIILAGNGDVDLWHAGSKRWLGLGKGISDILSCGDDLVARSDEGKLKVWQGQPGELDIVLVPIPYQIDNVTYFNFVPMASGRRPSFDTLPQVQGVTGMYPTSAPISNDLMVELADGSVRRYSDIKNRR